MLSNSAGNRVLIIVAAVQRQMPENSVILHGWWARGDRLPHSGVGLLVATSSGTQSGSTVGNAADACIKRNPARLGVNIVTMELGPCILTVR